MVVSVNLAVKFYGEPFLDAIEIQDIWTDAMLATELASVEIGVFEIFPESSLGWRESTAEFSSSVF